jgi:hypothetical protein
VFLHLRKLRPFNDHSKVVALQIVIGNVFHAYQCAADRKILKNILERTVETLKSQSVPPHRARSRPRAGRRGRPSDRETGRKDHPRYRGFPRGCSGVPGSICERGVKIDAHPFRTNFRCFS